MPATGGRRERGAVDRRAFLRWCGVVGVAVPLVGCGGDDDRDDADDGDGAAGDDGVGDDPAAGEGEIGDGGAVDGALDPGDPGDADGRSVIVVGAGAAGLTAAHLLTGVGVDVTVLEAAPTHGGRIRRTRDFVDFPIPLGAEWLHAEPDTPARIVGGGEVDETVDVELVGYGPDATLGYVDGELTIEPLEGDDDLKFVGSSWLDVYDEYIVPGIADRLRFGTRVVGVDSTGDRVVVTDDRGDEYRADAVIVTVPVAVLRSRTIIFEPDLGPDRWAAVDGVDVWGGIKVFVEFDTAFYPTFVAFPDSDTDAGQRLYYDAAYGQRSDANVLGLFAVGAPAEPYQGLDDDALRDHILTELDAIFDGAASRHYVQHVAQDWSAEPDIGQAYVADEADWRLVRTLGEPADDRVLFAGDAYTDGEDWGAVHLAAESARVAVERLLG